MNSQRAPGETAPLIKYDAIFRDLLNSWDLFKCSRLADLPQSFVNYFAAFGALRNFVEEAFLFGFI